MSTTVLDTAVIGAGAAGLTVGYHLAQQGGSFALFDASARIGDSWRERYRSLRLFTPRPFLNLPGLPIDIGRFSYPTRDQLADYLERYARHFDLPVRLSSEVVALRRLDDGRFRLELGTGDDVIARHVIVTTGAHRVPVTPAFASQLDPSIRQLHSLDYQGPEQFADGPVLVVGAANSGTDIALEAAANGHAVTLAGRHPGHVPVDIDLPIGNLLAGFFISRLRNATVDNEKGRAMMKAKAGHGIMLVRNSLKDLDRAGIVQTGRIERIESGLPVTVDGTPIDAATVVWCTGSRADFGWIDIDGVLDANGRLVAYRGVSTACAGLAFVGMEFQYSAASATLMGMGRDAEHVVATLAAASVPAEVAA